MQAVSMSSMTSENKKELETAFESIHELLAKRQKTLDEREKELEQQRKQLELEKQQMGVDSYKPSDVIHLNIGGDTTLAVLRKTLTLVEGSMLAARFSGRWDDSLEKDRDGNFFIDQPIELFRPMINYLRHCECETPRSLSVKSPDASFFEKRDATYTDFLRMVEYYGMTPGIYPTKFFFTVDYRKTPRSTIAVSSPENSRPLPWNPQDIRERFRALRLRWRRQKRFR